MINFLKYTWLYIIISIVVIGIGAFAVATQGINLAIDFTGGSVIQYGLTEDVSGNDVREAYEQAEIEIVNTTESPDDIELRTTMIDEDQEAEIRTNIASAAGELELRRFESVGPSLGSETITKTAIASAVAVLGILLYITFTFKKFTYGLAAVGAMTHDFLVLFGMYTLLNYFGAEIDALFITAVLTTMSFSVHDTIVVFDKIREYRRTSGLPIEVLANKALTETMVRSVNNSLTIILMLVPLTLMGGETIQFFAAALLIGTITGTYSSPFVATPLLVKLENML